MSADIASEIVAILEIEWPFGLEIRCGVFLALNQRLHPATLFRIPKDSGLIFSFAGSVLVYRREQLLL
jgi:hypothetical protein